MTQSHAFKKIAAGSQAAFREFLDDYLSSDLRATKAVIESELEQMALHGVINQRKEILRERAAPIGRELANRAIAKRHTMSHQQMELRAA